jgi:phosphatidate cytidylyltransferase
VLGTRLLAAALLIPPLFIALLLGGPILGAVVLGITTLAAREVFDLLGRAALPNRPLVGTALAVATAVVLWVAVDRPALLVAAVAAALVLPAAAAVLERDPSIGVRVWMATAWGALYAGLLGFLLRITVDAPSLPAGAVLSGVLDGGRAWLLAVVLTVWAADTGAYAVGRSVGRRAFAPHISPSKTWEGTIGGVASGAIAAAILVAALGASPVVGVILGVVVAVAAVVGDLAESVLKRAAGAKDSGSLIPGHGGMLDRVDSLLFAAPAAWLVVSLVRALSG